MRNHFIAIVILSICLAFLLTIATDEPVEIKSSIVDQTQNFDFFMSNIDSTFYNSQGVNQYRLQSTRSTHYPDPEYTLLDSPTFTIYQLESSPWLVSATHGKIEKDVVSNQDKVELNENVVINYIDKDGQTTNIYTDSIIISPDNKLIHTDSDVQITSTGLQMTATGLTADLKNNRVTLQSNIKSRYFE